MSEKARKTTSTRGSRNREARRWPWVVGLTSAGLLTWAVYKAAATRTAGRHPAGTRWHTGSGADVDMSLFTPGAAPIRCQAWDVGTGVQGYVWHAPDPKAVLLLQHGYGEYAHRFVREYKQLIPHALNIGISVYAFD